MENFVSLVAVRLAEEFPVDLLNVFVFVALAVRTALVVFIKSVCAQSFVVNKVAD